MKLIRDQSFVFFTITSDTCIKEYRIILVVPKKKKKLTPLRNSSMTSNT